MAEWFADVVDRKMGELGLTYLSRRYAVVNLVEGPSLDSLDPDILGWLTNPLLKDSPSPEFARRHGKLDYGLHRGDSYFISRTGIAFKVSPATKAARKRMRRFIHTAVDLTLAEETLLKSDLPLSELWAFEFALLYLSPILWSNPNRIVWDAWFSASYSRVSSVLRLPEEYERFAASTTKVLSVEQYEVLTRIQLAAKGLGLSLPTPEAQEILGGLEERIMRALVLKEASDRMGIAPSLALTLIGELLGTPSGPLEEAKAKIRDRTKKFGLSRPELSRILGVDFKDLDEPLQRLVNRGLVEYDSVRRTGEGRGTVRVYTASKLAEPMVKHWAWELLRKAGMRPS